MQKQKAQDTKRISSSLVSSFRDTEAAPGWPLEGRKAKELPTQKLLKRGGLDGKRPIRYDLIKCPSPSPQPQAPSHWLFSGTILQVILGVSRKWRQTQEGRGPEPARGSHWLHTWASGQQSWGPE